MNHFELCDHHRRYLPRPRPCCAASHWTRRGHARSKAHDHDEGHRARPRLAHMPWLRLRPCVLAEPWFRINQNCSLLSSVWRYPACDSLWQL